MTLQQLQYFRVLAKVQHYTKASEMLLISQPSLSYSMAELEKELHISLFDKHGKKVSLSTYGELFLRYVENALDQLDEGTKMLKMLIDPSKGKVNLGYIYSLSSTFLPEVITRFYKEELNKNITFNFVQNLNNSIMEDLRTGKIDLGFCVKPSKDVSFIPILKQELFLIVPKDHPYAGKKEIDIREVKDEPFVFINKRSGLRQMIDSTFKEMGITPKVMFEAEECNAVIAFVSLNSGVAVIPKVPALGNSDVSVMKIKNPEFYRTIYMAWVTDRHMLPSVKKVRDFVSEHYGIEEGSFLSSSR